MVSFSSRISPLTLTVIFFERSPLAMAVETSAILRTCAVRLLAIELTLSVKSFQVPATPITLACPTQPAIGADFPRDTRYLASKRVRLIDHRVDGLLQLQNLAAHVHGDLLREVSPRDGRCDLGNVANLSRQIPSH